MLSYSQNKLVSKFWDTLYNPMELYKKNFILSELFYCGFLHKRLPLGYKRAKTEDLTKILFCFCSQKGGYTRGVTYIRGVIHEALHYLPGGYLT